VVSEKREGKVWVLDHETKGTGAEMVPLEKKVDPARQSGGLVVVQEPKRGPEAEPEPRGPRRFRVVDVMTREVLADGADARTTVELLEGVRSVVDVSIYVWEEKAAKWQQLTQREAQMLWGLRGRATPPQRDRNAGGRS
jgi:hypothetical protein